MIDKTDPSSNSYVDLNKVVNDIFTKVKTPISYYVTGVMKYMQVDVIANDAKNPKIAIETLNTYTD